MPFEADDYGKRAQPVPVDRGAGWARQQLHHTIKFDVGEPLSGPDLPVVWRQHQTREAA